MYLGGTGDAREPRHLDEGLCAISRGAFVLIMLTFTHRRERLVRKRREKQAAWEEFATKCNRTTPLGEVWSQVRSFSCRKNIIRSFPQLVVHGIAATDCEEVTNAFARHFSSVSSTAIYPPDTHRSLLDKANGLNFDSDNSETYNAPFTLNELKLALAKSEEKTSMGPDGLPYSFFTNLNELNVSMFLFAINKLWSDHTFPDEWLESIIIPILKPGKDQQCVESYRPISLTNCACKIIERLVNTRLRYYLEANNLLDPFQSGFRGQHSTADNIARLISDVQTNWELRNPTVAVFLDLTSAFNKVHRSSVIYKLHTMGIRGHLAHFLRNFLQPRTFKVRCQSTLSDTEVLEHGVPQGSVLSPTLFLIAINDIFLSLPRSLTSIRYSLFADDLAIWCSHRKYQDCYFALQKAIDRIINWCSKWGFFLSAPKSAMIVFKRGPIPSLVLSPRINDIPIPFQRCHKFLGITLDSHLTFKTHVENVRTRCMKRINVLKCVSGFTWGADRKTLKMLYVGIIRSTLEYNCHLFSTISSTLCKRLEAVQSTCLRLITGAFRTSPILALRADTDLPALADRRSFLLLRYYYRAKSIHNHAAVPAMEVNRPITRRPLRRSTSLSAAVKHARQVFGLPEINISRRPPPLPFWLYNDLSISFLVSERKSDLSQQDIQTAFYDYRIANGEDFFYFTDGSVHRNRVGSAAIGPHFRFAARLPDCCTVFSAEVYAIKRVILHIKSAHVPQATVCTDSKSTLQALQKTEDLTHPGVYEIHKLILSLRADQHVTFLWIPGHSGISGNDRADSMAKEAAMLPDPEELPVALGDILHLTKIQFSKYLQEQWNNVHANHMFVIKPVLKPWSSCLQRSREREVLLSRMRCGHTRFTHSHLFDRIGPPICSSCDVRVSVEHILTSCTELIQGRQQLTAYLAAHQLQNSLSTLLGDADPMLLDLVLDFILKSPFAGKL